VLETIETDGFSACYVPDYTLRAHGETRFRAHLVRQLTDRLPYPSRREGECWYGTYVGQQWSTPLHLGVVARERPEAEAIMLGRLRDWQENSDEMRQIGPYFGLNRDYDHFLLGIAAPLWTLVAALFPGRDSKGYIAGELRLLVDELYRVRGPLEAILPALWLLWLAAAADADDAYESPGARHVSRRGQ
jgi:hypothetical protein